MATPEIEPKNVDELVRRWVDEIDMSREREKDWRKDGKEAEELYEASKEGEDSFNILYSNTETLAPSLYGNMPKPVVQRRFRDEDTLGKSVSQAGQRLLEFLLDTNSEEYDTFDESMKDATHDALLPGRGLVEFCYHAETADTPGQGEEGQDGYDPPGSQLVSECVYPKSFVWNRFYHGYAKRWCDVPWCAVELYLDKQAVEQEFGKEVADKTLYTIEGDANQDRRGEGKDNQVKTKIKTACIYKIWDKKKRVILWVSPNHPTSILRTDDDELKLTGFYPFPRPMRFLRKSNNLNPTALYKLYRTQARELNTISSRLIGLLKQCKVRGVYDSTIGEIEEVLKQEEGSLVPAENVAALQTTRGLEGAIWLMPIDKIVGVIKELYVAREACKRTIYEITGISDIVRGQSVATETLGAQKIKQEWVTLRLKNMQKEVQRFVRDALRIMLEIAAKRFQQQTWAQMTGLPYVTSEQLQQAQRIAQAAQQAGQPPPPEVAQQLQAPQWEQVIGVLKDDLQRQFKIDIETNSTLDVDASEDKQNLADLMNAISQFLNGVSPLVEKQMLPFQAAQAMLLVVVRKFRFGPEIEDYIKAMKEPTPQDNGDAAKLQHEAQQQQLDREQEQAKAQFEAAQKDKENQQKHEATLAEYQKEVQLQQADLAAQEQADVRKITAEREARLAELSSQRATEQMKADIQRKTDIDKATLEAAVAIQVAQIQAKAKADDSARQAAVDHHKNEQDAKLQKDNNDQQAALQKDAQKKEADGAAKKQEGDNKATAMMGDMMKAIMETQKQMIDLIGSDKEITRDDKGKAKGLKVVKKGASGGN